MHRSEFGRFLLILGILGVGLFTAGYVQAQSAANAFRGMGNNNEPIQIEADRLEIIDNQNTALLTGNVSVVQGQTILKAKRIKVFYLSDEQRNATNNGISKIEASGKVAIRSEDNHVTADSATVNMISELVTLTGQVYISQGLNIVKGCQVTVNLKTNVSNVKPCASKKGRVQIVLDPKSRNNSQ